jgi:hypothetical protein
MNEKSAKNPAPKTSKRRVWEPTKEPGLLRYRPAGTYYSRTEIGGTQRKRCQGDDFELAVEKHHAWLRDVRRGAVVASNTPKTDSAWANWEERFLTTNERNCDIGQKATSYYIERLTGVARTWGTLADTDIKKLTKTDIQNYVAETAKTLSADTVRGNLLTIRMVLDIAVSAGYLTKNPADGVSGPAARRRLAHSAKHQTSPATFDLILSDIRRQMGGVPNARPTSLSCWRVWRYELAKPSESCGEMSTGRSGK